MKILHKWLLTLCVAIACLTIVTSWALTHIEKKINVLMPSSFSDASQNLAKEFNRTHRGRIHLTITKGPLQTESISDLAISSLILGKAPFDLLLMDVTWVPLYAAADWLMPLDRWFSKSDIESLAGGAKLGNSYQGKLYRWPYVTSMGLLYWRTDLMNKPPRTPDELISVSKKLQEDKKIPYGYVWQGRQYEGLSCNFLEVIDGFGGTWLDIKTGKVGLNSPAAIEAAEWMKELITSGVSPESVTNFAEPESLQAFRSGDAALMRNWPFAWAELQRPDSSVKGLVGVTTMVSSPRHSPAATLGSWGMAILKGTPNPDAAAEVIKFMSSEKAQKELFIKHGYTPTQSAVFNDKELIDYSPILSELLRALEVTKARPETPLYAQISDVLQRQLSSILTGQDKVDDGMNRAQQNTEQILISSGEKT